MFYILLGVACGWLVLRCTRQFVHDVGGCAQCAHACTNAPPKGDRELERSAHLLTTTTTTTTTTRLSVIEHHISRMLEFLRFSYNYCMS